MPIPLPSLSEQTAMIDRLDRELDATSANCLAFEASLKQAAAQRQNILRAAFSGQLVPQDPNDEPASELLARIRAEREASGRSAKARNRKAATATT
jgi:type I restriction enzyme, S subunit